MHIVFDTHYADTSAKTVGLAFENWTDHIASQIYEETIDGIAPYESGSFYKRELPCLLSILKKIDTELVETIVIDGFVVLDDQGKKGLGAYLYESLDKEIPIIGVAKNDYKQLQHSKRSLLRGESTKLLYITAVGIDIDQATLLIAQMHGAYRFPTLLKEVDRLGRI